MKKVKKLFKPKILLIFFYLLIITFFYNSLFDFQFNKEEVLNFLLKNKEKLDFFITNNFFYLSLIFFISTIAWTLCLGFGLPILIVGAYLFDPLNGTLICVLSKTIGVSIIFIFYNKIFKNYLINKIKFKRIIQNKLSKLLKKNELYYLILFRLFPGIPVQVVDILPLFIGVKFKNYILSKFLGSLIPHYIIISFFSALFENLDRNLDTKLNFSVTRELLIVFLVFSLFIIISKLIKKKINLNK